MTESDDYERGVVDTTLKEHGTHLSKINGSMAEVASEMKIHSKEIHQLTLSIQSIADQMISNDRAVLATAKALKEANENAWTPVTKIIAIVAIIATIISVILGIINITN